LSFIFYFPASFSHFFLFFYLSYLLLINYHLGTKKKGKIFKGISANSYRTAKVFFLNVIQGLKFLCYIFWGIQALVTLIF
jgi:hypothetical protein